MKQINFAILCFEILVLISMFYTPWGNLTFGYGLGDLAIFIFITIAVVIHLLMTLILISNKANNQKFILPLLIFGTFTLIILYFLFFDRGIECRELFYAPHIK